MLKNIKDQVYSLEGWYREFMRTSNETAKVGVLQSITALRYYLDKLEAEVRNAS